MRCFWLLKVECSLGCSKVAGVLVSFLLRPCWWCTPGKEDNWWFTRRCGVPGHQPEQSLGVSRELGSGGQELFGLQACSSAKDIIL